MDMAAFGFIHGELDIKILILYILRRLPAPVEAERLTELAADCDDGVGWFDYAQCLSALVETEHIEALPGPRYLITEKGARNGETTESSIPYSVRMKAERLLAPLSEQMRRSAMIRAEHTAGEDGCKVSLSLSDGRGEIMGLTLLVGGEEDARLCEENFRRDAEALYEKITETVMGKDI